MSRFSCRYLETRQRLPEGMESGRKPSLGIKNCGADRKLPFILCFLSTVHPKGSGDLERNWSLILFEIFYLSSRVSGGTTRSPQKGYCHYLTLFLPTWHVWNTASLTAARMEDLLTEDSQRICRISFTFFFNGLSMDISLVWLSSFLNACLNILVKEIKIL